MWGDYRMEVKEGTSCGPGSNQFTKNTVSVEGDELILEYKKIGGAWEASEVRILLPNHENDKFEYGEYKFHVKSVEVMSSGSVKGTKLPKDLVLGLFTWDPTEKFAGLEPQNYMHEVDIEIAQWNDANRADVQFLMQPPGSPQMHRFYSGTMTGNRFEPSNHWYSFNWLPGGISWASTAGGGQQHEYTVADAVKQSRRDYVQCLPADIEVRVNLWNMFGSRAPDGLSDTEYVKVVIDRFEYIESTERYIADGEYCSKHCQCAGYCLSGRCENVEPSPPSTRAPSKTPVMTPTKKPTAIAPSPCGCPDCTNDVLNTMAGDHTCGARIQWLQSSFGGSLSERDACIKVANDEFPDVCGPMCDPKSCAKETNTPTTSPSSAPLQTPVMTPKKKSKRKKRS